MRDNKCIIHKVSNVVDDGYKINVSTSVWFKVFSQHLTYIFYMHRDWDVYEGEYVRGERAIPKESEEIRKIMSECQRHEGGKR